MRHQRRKLLVLRQCVTPDALQGQQSFLPFAVEKEPLLRAMAQVPLVIDPAATLALTQSKLFQQVLQLCGVIARHGQVVRTQRASNSAHRTAAAVAPGLVFEFEQREVIHAPEAQSAPGGQPGDATPGDDDTRLVSFGRSRPGRAFTQLVPTRRVDTGEPALDLAHCLATRQRQRGAGQEMAPFHQCPSALPHSAS